MSFVRKPSCSYSICFTWLGFSSSSIKLSRWCSGDGYFRWADGLWSMPARVWLSSRYSFGVCSKYKSYRQVCFSFVFQATCTHCANLLLSKTMKWETALEGDFLGAHFKGVKYFLLPQLCRHMLGGCFVCKWTDTSNMMQLWVECAKIYQSQYCSIKEVWFSSYQGVYMFSQAMVRS